MADYAAIFQPNYFGSAFPQYSEEFVFANAFYCLVPSAIGALYGGYLSDKYEKVNYMSKAWIILAANGISIPFCAAGFLQTDDFWFAIVMVSIMWFFTELWISPVITML